NPITGRKVPPRISTRRLRMAGPFFNSRRAALRTLAAGAIMTMTHSNSSSAAMPLIKRSIPRSGEQLPVLGLGTYIVLDVPPGASELAELKEVLKTFTAGGARVIDTSQMYGWTQALPGPLGRD